MRTQIPVLVSFLTLRHSTLPWDFSGRRFSLLPVPARVRLLHSREIAVEVYGGVELPRSWWPGTRKGEVPERTSLGVTFSAPGHVTMTHSAVLRRELY